MQPQRFKRSRISSFEWWILLGFVVFIDLLQIVLDVLTIGLVINRLDIIIGGSIIFYMMWREYKLDAGDWVLMGASVIGEEIPILDAAPFWTLDIWRFRQKDLARKTAEEMDAEARDNRESLDRAA